MPTGTDSKLDVTADDAMRKASQSDKVALAGGTARAADTGYDEIERKRKLLRNTENIYRKKDKERGGTSEENKYE